ncbi:MAG TPA: ABC transporter permease, partial [Bacteroidia bacterium]|nr:ABC transporter permease [Bacteroidia bacterium]
FFTWRDVKVKYKQTFFGFAWAIFQPLLLMVIFSLPGRAFNIPSRGMPYPLFTYSGLILWLIFSSGITNAGNSMIGNANIIKKIYFPRLIIPISSILVSLFDFLMAFIVFVCMLIYYQVHINVLRFIVILPVSIGITTICTFGVGSLLAALNIKYRDFRHVIPFMVQVLLFVTPVIYPVEMFAKISHEWAKYVFALNPMYSAIELFRSTFSDQPLHFGLIGISVASAFFFFLVGLYYFRKTEVYFADLA